MKQHAAEIGKIDPIVQPFSPVWGLPTAGEFELESTLESGQSFQWARDEHGWHTGWVKGRLYRVHQHAGSVFFASPDPGDSNELSGYLQSDFDTRVMRKFLLQLDSFLSDAIAFSPGLRILKQDPWECLAGFILSSTKQVAHIKQIWAHVCERHGTSIEWGSRRFHRFPPPETIASLDERQLRECRMGFRARYLLSAARAVASGSIRLDSPAELSTREARAYLTRLAGVGDKIADCVLLYAYQKWDSFPRDVWINRVLERIYFRGKRKPSKEKMDRFITEYFGPYAGYAQQFLFHYARLNPKALK
jgi:N-glycosylase/DNA lyase